MVWCLKSGWGWWEAAQWNVLSSRRVSCMRFPNVWPSPSTSTFKSPFVLFRTLIFNLWHSLLSGNLLLIVFFQRFCRRCSGVCFLRGLVRFRTWSHQSEQLALAEQRVGKAEAIELNLLRRKNTELLDEPVVKRTMIFEFERANGVRDMLDGIGLPVREVVHGIDAPLAAGAVVLGVQDAVHDRIAHVEVRRRHVDLGA